MPEVPYYFDPIDNTLRADPVSVSFPYKEEEITNAIIYEALSALEDVLREYYKNEKGIILYDFD